ncbi:MAG: Tim44 domain-containing protein [Coriobacteriales bacterium]|jgi:hypothetical protein|nr:Tim44 domain-containing protein [Coriobacteriales bacterium]
MRARKTILAVLISTLCLVGFFSLSTVVFADIGNQNDYGGSSDFGGSSDWGGSSSSDWGSSSDWDSGSSSSSYYGSSSSSSDYTLSPLECLIPLVFLGILLFLVLWSLRRKLGHPFFSSPTISPVPYQGPAPAPDQLALEAEIKERDPNFDANELKGWVKELFLALNKAWTARDWQRVRIFETNSLFNEHNQLLEQYRRDKRINMIEQIGIREVDLRSYRFDDRFEYLEVSIHAQLIDYVLDEQTNLVVAGSKAQLVHMFYTLVFKRTAGAQSKDSLLDVGETNCPNCGAPLQITVAGQCEYCGTIVMADEYSWALDQFTGKRL